MPSFWLNNTPNYPQIGLQCIWIYSVDQDKSLSSITMPFEMQYTLYMQFLKFPQVASIANHISYLERVHKSLIVLHLTSVYRNWITWALGIVYFLLKVCSTNTHIIKWPFLTRCHHGINKDLDKDFMHSCMPLEKLL